jgi:hypothetical protein
VTDVMIYKYFRRTIWRFVLKQIHHNNGFREKRHFFAEIGENR